MRVLIHLLARYEAKLSFLLLSFLAMLWPGITEDDVFSFSGLYYYYFTVWALIVFYLWLVSLKR